MTKTEIASIHNEINAAIAAVLAKHNLKSNGSGIRYTENDFTYKLKVNVLDPVTGTKKVTPNTLANAKWAFFKNGFTHIEDVDVKHLFETSFNDNQIGEFKVVDVDTKKHKYPFIAENTKGQRYKLSVNQLLAVTNIPTHQ